LTDEANRTAAEQTMPEIRVDDQLHRLLRNSSMLETFVALIEKRGSPSDIAERLKIKLSKAIYCVEQLEEMNLIEEVDTERRRGQDAHIFKAVMRPIWKTEEWEQLSQDERERLVAWVLQLFLRDVARAWTARTFQARVDTHTSRSPLRVDGQGWRDIKSILDGALASIHEVEVESVDRLREAGDDAELILARAAMFLIEMPPSESPK
jgi:predicted transcriptional regulator